ncbi:MAG: ABC transporter ATP-binding protein [Stellaceae bacterium]
MSEPHKTLLEVKRLAMRFGDRRVIENLSFTAFEREITAIIGPNGAGKTAVIDCLTGFHRPSGGTITLHRGPRHYRLERMDSRHIAREAGVARIVPDIGLYADMTLLENLIVAQQGEIMRANMFSIADLFGFSPYRRAEKQAAVKARRWLDRLGLIDRAEMVAGGLTHGDRRRLEIARAMCSGSVLLCLDEPTVGLDPDESERLNKLLLAISDQHGIGLLRIEHDMNRVLDGSNRVIVLDHGRKIAEGMPEEVRLNPAVVAAYRDASEAEAARE